MNNIFSVIDLAMKYRKNPNYRIGAKILQYDPDFYLYDAVIVTIKKIINKNVKRGATRKPIYLP